MHNNFCLQALGSPTLTGHPLSRPCMHIGFMCKHETHNVYNQRKTDSTELLPIVRNPLRTASFVATVDAQINTAYTHSHVRVSAADHPTIHACYMLQIY